MIERLLSKIREHGPEIINELNSPNKDTKYIERKAKNIILAEWIYLPKYLETMKKLALAILTLYLYTQMKYKLL